MRENKRRRSAQRAAQRAKQRELANYQAEQSVSEFTEGLVDTAYQERCTTA